MKSNVKDYIEMAQLVYQDACAQCSARVSDLRDLKTLRSRVAHEGLSFLTITLPQFASDLERAVADGVIGPDHFLGFAKWGAIPAFLQGMLVHVFDRETGRLRDDSPDVPQILESCRQICYTFKKLRLPCSPAREDAAIKRFLSVEQELQSSPIAPEARAEFTSVAFVLWCRMLGGLLPDMLLPRHGPGATAERIMGNQKYAWLRWHERLEPYFPFLGYAYSVSSWDDRSFEKVTFVPAADEQPVRVVFVPKTLKSPRVIAIEPVCMQYTQQAVQAWLYQAIAADEISGGHVNFTDQSVNRSLALSASASGQWATIDLSDASDRVPRDLALSMFDSNPDLRDAIDACRSTRATLPGGMTIPLAKFASMGSALCFPVEAMYFYTACVVGLLRKYNLPLTRHSVKRVASMVYVYGDDIIVPADCADAVLESLHQYKCKANSRKSFWTGKFRESCGLDAYAGREITPTYLRELRPENRQQVDRIVSWVATGNLFERRGYSRTASFMFAHVEAILGSLPWVSADSALLGRIDHLSLRSPYRQPGLRFRKRYQRLEQRGWVVTPVYRSDRIDGYAALQKSLLRLEARNSSQQWDDGPTGPTGRSPGDGSTVAHSYLLKWLSLQGREESSMELTARRGAVTLQRRWVPVT